MQSKKHGLVVVLAAVALPAVAADIGGWYVRGDVGYSWARDARARNVPSTAVPQIIGTLNNFDDAGLAGIGLGLRTSKTFRTDLTWTERRKYDLDQVDPGAAAPQARFRTDVRSSALMLNGYWDFDMGAWKPFIGGGLGWARNRSSNLTYSESVTPLAGTAPGGTKNNFAWQLTAGAGFEVSPRTTVDVSYRYADLGKFKTNSGQNTLTLPVAATFAADGIEGKLQSNELNVGLRYSF